MSSSRDSHSQASTSQSTTDFLQNATFSRSDNSPMPSDHAVTASDLLMAAYDPAKLHPLADLGDKLDYLLLDDDKTNELPGAGTAIPSRGWGDDLCYGTGTMYLTGAYRSLSNYCFRKPCARLRPRLFPEQLSPYLSSLSFFRPLIVLFCHMLTLFFFFQVWPLVVCGGCGKALGDLLPCQILGCGSTVS